MATYLELRGLYNDDNLQNKVEIALTIAANEVLQGDDTAPPYSQAAGAHDKRVRFAYRIIQNTANTAEEALKLVLAENNGLTVAQIQGANDSAFLTNVKDLFDELSNGLEFDEPTTP